VFLYLSGTNYFKDNSDLRHPTLTLPTREGTRPILIPSLLGRVRDNDTRIRVLFAEYLLEFTTHPLTPS
jgi:hypothetical protein